MSLVMAILTPGPLIIRAWVVWPLFCATKVYLPALKVFWDRAMWKSVSTALTVVTLAAEAGAADTTVAPAVAASATREAEAAYRMECMGVLWGRCCVDVTVVGTAQIPSGIDSAAGSRESGEVLRPGAEHPSGPPAPIRGR